MAKPSSTLVIDNGSSHLKFGYADDDKPTIVPSIINGSNNFTVSNRRPIVSGIIENWVDIQKLWQPIFDRSENQNRPVLMSEVSHNPRLHRMKLTQDMFEKFDVPLFYIANKSMLALFAYGKYTGLVVDSGYIVTHVVPVYEGHVIEHAIIRSNIGGQHITDHFITDYESTATVDYNRLKEDVCYIAEDFQTNTDKYAIYAESLFDPSKITGDNCGIHLMINNAISKCDERIQREMWSNIVLAGGNTLFRGLKNRLQKELEILTSMKVTIHDAPNRQYYTWHGGSMLAETSNFEQMAITIDDYNEYGPNIVHRKCF